MTAERRKNTARRNSPTRDEGQSFHNFKKAKLETSFEHEEEISKESSNSRLISESAGYSTPASISSSASNEAHSTSAKDFTERSERIYKRLAKALEQWYRDTYQLGQSVIVTQEEEDDMSKVGTSRGSRVDTQQIARLKAHEAKLKSFVEKCGLRPADKSQEQILQPSENDDSKPTVEELHELIKRIIVDVKSAKNEAEILSLGQLSITKQGGTRYVGGGFWAFHENENDTLMEVIKDRDSLIRAPAERLRKVVQVASDQFTWYGRTVEVNPAEHKILVSALPSKSQCDALCKSYFHGVHPLMPMLHAPTFIAHYRAFWADHQQRAERGFAVTEDTPYVVLLSAVLFAGAISSSSEEVSSLFDGRPKSSIIAQLLSTANLALEIFQFPKVATYKSLMAFLIIRSCLLGDEEPLMSSNMVSMAMRIAQSMGLHRDGGHYGLSEVECEVRRRIWWHILYLDCQVSIAAGLPPLTGGDESMYDTLMVSELKDEFLESPLKSESAIERSNVKSSQDSQAEKLSTAMILTIGRFEMTLALRKVMTRLSGVRKISKCELIQLNHAILSLKRRTEELQQRIPAEDQSPIAAWARLWLKGFSDMACAVLARPFFKCSKNNSWLRLRASALPPCQRYLKTYIKACTEPAFQPFHWLIPGTPACQPFHATVILLLDTIQVPDSPEAAENRQSVDQILKAFDDYLQVNNINGKDPNKKCLMWFKELRKKSYEKAGLIWERTKEESGLKESDESALKPTKPSTPAALNSKVAIKDYGQAGQASISDGEPSSMSWEPKNCSLVLTDAGDTNSIPSVQGSQFAEHSGVELGGIQTNTAQDYGVIDGARNGIPQHHSFTVMEPAGFDMEHWNEVFNCVDLSAEAFEDIPDIMNEFAWDPYPMLE
ncbi:fungal-specific transcription factor domain-containing protein [Kalaharituber pfeilii]|nr:fungal-specific transcription factor domain-containing protein [Kalaharituber pfeilii]